MAHTSLIRADGKSPLTRYVNLLVSMPANLELLLDRDAEAVRILTATPALPEAIRRAERWYWDRQREKQTCGIVLTRRIWTRRDERFLKQMQGLLPAGILPARRAARFLDRVKPRRLHEKWFRLAVDECNQTGRASVISKLERADKIFDRLISAAQSAAYDNVGREEFGSTKWEMGSLASELMKRLRVPKETVNGGQGNDEAESTTPKGSTGKSEKSLLWLAKALLLVREHPDWSDAEISRQVGKSKSTLSRSKEYQTAAAMARGVKDDRHRGHISVNPYSGLREVEAYSDDPAERDWDD
ncbi:MAG: hypothetical protein VX768_08055 [Planctomycetota bacterium]|nr:hypothetical protein [Planctomycetota bacterium]